MSSRIAPLIRRLPTRTSTRRCLSTSPRCLDRYGFIGLGKMGYPMAVNLRKGLAEGDSLVVYDVNKEATAKFADEFRSGGGVAVGEDVADVVRSSDTIITMLPEPSHVKSVFAAINSTALPDSSVPKLFIDSSTIDIATSISTGRLLVEAHPTATFIDAPVSGGVVGATAGSLTFMLGAPPALLPAINRTLSHLGARILHCGPPGSGLAAKLANNMLLAYTNIAVAEAMNLGLKLGLDGEVIKSVVNSSSGRCWASEVNNPLDKERTEYAGGFAVELMRKDLKLAVKAAEGCGAKLLLDKVAEDVYGGLVQSEPGKDFSVVYKWLKEQSEQGK